MKKYLKSFLHRGLIFGGFGPMILGIIYASLEAAIDGFSLSGNEVLIGIISTYFLAFLQAGASVFNQIEHWPIAKSLLCHFSTVYAAYISCYLINSWIPFDPTVIVIFSAIFIVAYFVIWLSVVAIIKATEKRLNEKMK